MPKTVNLQRCSIVRVQHANNMPLLATYPQVSNQALADEKARTDVLLARQYNLIGLMAQQGLFGSSSGCSASALHEKTLGAAAAIIQLMLQMHCLSLHTASGQHGSFKPQQQVCHIPGMLTRCLNSVATGCPACCSLDNCCCGFC